MSNKVSTLEATVSTAPESAPESTSSVEAHEIPFIETLPQAVRDLPELSGVADIDGFVNRISDITKGPQAPDNYEFQIPEGLQPQQEIMDRFKSVAKEAKLNQKQADKVLEMWHELQFQAKSNMDQAAETASTTLKKEWGKDYENNLAMSRNAVAKFGGKDLAEYLDSSGLGNHISLIRTFQMIGAAMSEDSVVGLEPQIKPAEIKRWNGLPLLDFNM